MATEISSERANVSIRQLQEEDLPKADYIMRLAFGTFLDLPEPASFMGDAAYVATRWAADPASSHAAELEGELVGSNFAANWGSVGFFGPLTVRPDLWDRHVAQDLLGSTMELFDTWGSRHIGLFTFPQSSKHIHLYQKFGFWPRFLTPVMACSVRRLETAPEWSLFSSSDDGEQQIALGACREVTDAIYDGLDLSREILAVEKQKLGDTVLLWNHSRLAGFAVCHSGPGTEAGGGACFVKFGAVRPSPTASRDFERLLDACEAFAAARGVARLTAGVNVARHEAYRSLIARGFRTDLEGIAMQKNNEPGYNREGVYVLDDWR
jgi:Acetyltransferase (GNAT) family